MIERKADPSGSAAPTVDDPALDAGDTAASGAVGHTAADPPMIGRIGRFRIEAPLGSGGMADVFRAYDPVLERAVALKILRTQREHDDPQRRRRVLREARAAAALTHPNTVTIFDVGEANGEVFIAMELLEGEALRAVQKQTGILLGQKLAWLLQAARALAAAHERGLVHRDVKPDNMFVCRDGTLKLLDFGIAKRQEDDSQEVGPGSKAPSSLRTAEGRRVGTPRYMAPEQHAGERTDPRTDEYAWGLVAFELLTGTHPAVVLDAVTSAEAGADRIALASVLRAEAPALSATIAATILRALEVGRDDRFPSMAPIVAALDPGPLPEGDRPAPRRDLFLPAAAVVAAVLAIGAVGVWRLRARTSARPEVTVRALPPACRVERTRSFALTSKDRVAVMPNGDMATLRGIDRGLVLTRETAAGPVPFSSESFPGRALTALGTNYIDVALEGVRADGVSWALAEVTQPAEKHGVVVLGLTARRDFFMQAVAPHQVSSLAATAFGKDVVLAATTTQVEGQTSGALAYLPNQRGRLSVVEAGTAYAAAIAASKTRIAFAYDLDRSGPNAELHLALLDEELNRLGDAHTVTAMPRPAPRPAVAFAGETAMVFWIDVRSEKSRLTTSTFPPGAPAPSAPRVVIDEAVTVQTPVTAQRPDGTWVIAWVASAGGATTLRVSPIGPDGSLTGPTDVAPLPTAQRLRATSGDDGVELSWQEAAPNGASVLKAAHVICPPPPR